MTEYSRDLVIIIVLLGSMVVIIIAEAGEEQPTVGVDYDNYDFYTEK